LQINLRSRSPPSYALLKPIRLTYHGGERTILKRDAMLIRVEADNGLVGYAPGQGSERAKQESNRSSRRFWKAAH